MINLSFFRYSMKLLMTLLFLNHFCYFLIKENQHLSHTIKEFLVTFELNLIECCVFKFKRCCLICNKVWFIIISRLKSYKLYIHKIFSTVIYIIITQGRCIVILKCVYVFWVKERRIFTLKPCRAIGNTGRD